MLASKDRKRWSHKYREPSQIGKLSRQVKGGKSEETCFLENKTSNIFFYIKFTRFEIAGLKLG
jgi:hypothetical protein